MPLNPLAALLYPFFLVPGLIFLSRVEAHLPARKRSIFRETATVVFASVGASAFVLLLYVAVSLLDWKLPIETLTEFVSHPAAVFSTHPRATIVGLLAFLALAGLVAWVAGSKDIYGVGRSILWFKSGDAVPATTAWQRVLMTGSDSDEVLVGVQLKSGTWLQGIHNAHSDVAEDSSDQQLVLHSPLRYRRADDEPLRNIDQFDRLVVRASEIDYFTSVVQQKKP